MTAVSDRPSLAAGRSAALDRLRGLAVLLMVLDHVLLLTAAAPWLRESLTRAAMPLFFVLAGHLVSRLRWRHGWVLLAGLALPVLVPWIDDPNVLVWYVVGTVVLVLARVAGVAPALLVGLALTLYANSMEPAPPGSYAPLALVGLMALGQLLPRSAFSAGERLPSFVAAAGRFPLSVYVGHLLVLEVVRSL